MGFTPEEMRDFIGSSFGPNLHSRGYGHLKLMILDDNRVFLPGWANVVMNDTEVRRYVSGIAIHSYFDYLDPTGLKLRQTHNDFPDKFMLYTETSVVPIMDVTTTPDSNAVRLGNWQRAQNYTSNIIQDLNNFVIGWIDWNMVLNTEGGPNWVGNYVDAPIIANASANEFYKQPLFYSMAHFAKFVTPGSRRIGYRISNNTLVECAIFLRPDNNIAIVLQNRPAELQRSFFMFRGLNIRLLIVLVDDNQRIVIPTQANSMHSVIYKSSIKHNRNKSSSILVNMLGLLKTEEFPNSLAGQSNNCQRLKLPEEASHACVCSERSCDQFTQPPEQLLRGNNYVYYTSSSAGKRLEATTGQFLNNPRSSIIRVDSERRYQEIFGFGGAMTDSACVNIAKLSRNMQELLLSQYFGRTGIGYSFIRVPFAGTDFSTYNYTYDDTIDDESLRFFSLKEEDTNYKIPYIKLAQSISPVPIKLFSSSWTAPEWMKESRNGTLGISRLQRRYYQLYSDYYIRCLDEYKKNGLQFWGISPQNEPFHGFNNYYGFNSMGWSPQEQKEWLGNFFGPTLQARGYGNVKLMILDDNRVFLPGWATVVMSDPVVRSFVHGIAIHWYFDFLDPQGKRLSDTHYEFPDNLAVDGCNATLNSPVRLGNWVRAENYTSNIIQDMNRWVTGWVDWNLALDTSGGPNWANNRVESPIIVNERTNEFYKQPMFYNLAHFSKFILPGSRRIAYRISSDDIIKCVAFLRPDNIVAIVLQNRMDVDADVVILVQNRKSIVVPAPAHSVHTVLYKLT
ncbi:hypothetical protein L9F63_027919, partial [Diploptera punctata]